MPVNHPDGEPCEHPGCLAHISHPCDGCGRVAGRSVHRGCRLCREPVEQARIALLNSDVCAKCANAGHGQRKVRGIMAFDHKTAPHLVVTTEEAYDKFRNDTDREGQGSILERQGREDEFDYKKRRKETDEP